MSNPYSVTVEEVARLLSEAVSPPPVSVKARDQDGSEKEAHHWSLSNGGTGLLGIHIRSQTTFIVWLSKGFEVRFQTVINAGYDTLDRLSPELARVLPKEGPIPTVVSLSGKHSHYFIQKAPAVSKANLLKSFRLQMKQLAHEEREDISFITLPSVEKEGAPKEYLVASTAMALIEKIAEILRKHKLKLSSWDADILCYARATSAIWQREQVLGTRLGIIMGWNRCRLVMLGRSGQFAAPMLSFGVASFLENLAQTLGEPTLRADWLDPKNLAIKSSDPKDLKVKKALANQANFSLYVPFAQQVKLHVNAICADTNMALPSRFCVLGPGAGLLRIVESLEIDLGLSAIDYQNWIKPEMAGALGAALWDRHDMRINLLPKGKAEIIQIARELLGGAQNRWGRFLPKGGARVPSFGGEGLKKSFIIILAVVGALSLFPVWTRMSTSRSLAKLQVELVALRPQEEALEGFSKKKRTLERKQALKKLIESKQPNVGLVFKEILFNLPKQIRITYLSFKDNGVSLKGISQTQEDLERFLDLTTKFRYVVDPTPANMRREKEAISFELAMKAKL